MSLVIASLNSGSNGNCYYIGNESESVLIDAGISCRETERRMTRMGLSIHSVRAIFVSHEHSDHITGVSRLSKKYRIPVYITASTFHSSGIIIEQHLMKSFHPQEPVTIGNLTIRSFTKVHDASDPHSFMVSGNNINIGVFTDIGHACKEVIRYFKQCQAAFLESNYCSDMLESGNYPYHLKKRISGNNGHLSNVQALELFVKYRSPQLTHLILSHLSENNNRPELVEQLFNAKAGTTKIIVASRYAESEVYTINSSGTSLGKKNRQKALQLQLSLFQPADQ
jgi:phosphoribosyl 1,2-cyclic phosphodiesterase